MGWMAISWSSERTSTITSSRFPAESGPMTRTLGGSRIGVQVYGHDLVLDGVQHVAFENAVLASGAVDLHRQAA